MAKRKKKEEVKLRKGIKEIKMLFDTYVNKVSEILSPWDELYDEVLSEIIEQEEIFRNELDAMTELPEDFDLCMEKLEAMDCYDLDRERLLDLICSQEDDLPGTSMGDYMHKKGWAVIFIDSLENEYKVLELCQQIFPYANDAYKYNL